MFESCLPDIPKSAHFIGIGGAGMSGIALVLHERGCKVTGSDLKESHYVRELKEAGIKVYIGHKASNIDIESPEVVVCSTAIPETNPEVIRARELGLEVWPRAKMLSALSKGAKTIAIAGTHGKTTTSSMVATMLDRMELDPSFLIGGIVEGYDTNGKNGSGNIFVAEADESDGSFLYLAPDIVVVTNIEADHLDHYGTLENIEKTFVKFMKSAGPEGTIIVCGENPHVVDLARSTGRTCITYGFGDDCDFVVAPKPNHGLATPMTISCDKGEFDVVIKANPGRHNMLNACAALAVAYVMDLPLDKAAVCLSEFKGARRRFTHIADVDDICIVDDYAHHPTEVAATVAAARSLGFERVFVCFQPHRYSRTQALAPEFAHAFDGCDKLFVMDVFAASETPIPGVSGKTIATAVEAGKGVAQVSYIPSRTKLIGTLVQELKPSDLIITMGAGDVTLIGPRLAEALGEKEI